MDASDFIYDLAQTSGIGISRLKWFDLLNEERALTRPAPPITRAALPPPVSTSPPQQEEIREIVFAHLRSIGATSESTGIYRSQLRPAIERNNPSLSHRMPGPLFGVRLKGVIDSAIAEGLLAQPAPSTAGQEKLWLAEPKPVVPTISAPAVAAPLGSAPVATVGATTSAPSEPVYARSAEFRKRLTDLGVFCGKRERDIFFEALGRILKKSPMTISQLRRELPKVAEEIANERGTNCPNFKRIVNFFIKLLLVSDVLRGPDGEPIKRTVSAEASQVSALDDAAVDKAERYMLEQILKKSDVKDREQWQLAFAIFRQFDQSVEVDGMLDRVATLIAGLGHHFILTDGGVYEYTESSGGSNVVPLRA